MKKLLSAAAAVLASVVFLTACGADSSQKIVSEALGVDASAGSAVWEYDTYGGNGDGVSCIALRFSNDAVLKEIQDSPDWKAFPLDETVPTLVYGTEEGTRAEGPFLTGENGEPLVPEIQSGYYLLIDRQAEKDQATGADILHRSSFNFTLGLYDDGSGTLYCCRLDT